MKHEHYMDMNRLSDWSVDQINELLDVCLLLKEMEEKGVRLPLLKDVSLAMMFDQQSTRTRVSFETAMTQFGGHAMFLDGSSLQCRLWPRGYRGDCGHYFFHGRRHHDS